MDDADKLRLIKPHIMETIGTGYHAKFQDFVRAGGYLEEMVAFMAVGIYLQRIRSEREENNLRPGLRTSIMNEMSRERGDRDPMFKNRREILDNVRIELTRAIENPRDDREFNIDLKDPDNPTQVNTFPATCHVHKSGTFMSMDVDASPLERKTMLGRILAKSGIQGPRHMKRTRIMTIDFILHPVFGLATAIKLLQNVKTRILLTSLTMPSGKTLTPPRVKIETTYNVNNDNVASLSAKMHIMF